jgi:transposase
MRLTITKNKNSSSFYVIKSVTINGKRTSKVIEKLGNLDEVKIKAQGKDPYKWAQDYVDLLNKEEKDNYNDILLKLSQTKSLEKNTNFLFNGGYLFLQDIYYDLGINNICNSISDKYQFKYDLNDILSKLIYSRIIYPSSKLKTLELSKHFIEQPNFEYQHILRALEVISKESDFIQSELYKNSIKNSKRNDKILFYDCTNYYFEIEEDDDFRKYGKSKEHRPNPIVGMGLFMDGDGIPLSFDTFPGNTNEQVTLKPLEKKIINDFDSSKFIVCTDAGLASNYNRKFNNKNNRKYITTQSLKKLKEFLKEWSLDLSKGWKLPGSDKMFNISELRINKDLIKKYYDKVFYKERWIKEDNIEQRLIVTYSPKYQEYQRSIRVKQITRAENIINKNPKNIKSNNENDSKRFITNIPTTDNGEVALNNNYTLNQDKIDDEAKYDGFYSVCTNLEDEVTEIIKINKRRWEIEESFRIMKSEFKARPVFLSREDRIKAHFTTCFLALVIYRYLEKKLNGEYTVSQIIETLKEYNFREFKGFGYVPTYTYTDLIEKLNENFSINTSKEIIEHKNFKKIINQTKKQKITHFLSNKKIS